jgi:hypothetical protein
MSAHSFLRPLWRTLGGVFGVSALLGLAYAIGWVHERVGLPQA